MRVTRDKILNLLENEYVRHLGSFPIVTIMNDAACTLDLLPDGPPLLGFRALLVRRPCPSTSAPPPLLEHLSDQSTTRSNSDLTLSPIDQLLLPDILILAPVIMVASKEFTLLCLENPLLGALDNPSFPCLTAA